MVTKSEKIEAALMLASYLETIGFNNGKWEFNFGTRIENIFDALSINYKIINHYQALGGFNYIDINKWNASDDTILMMSVTESLLKGGEEKDFIENYIKILEDLKQEIRFSGINTVESIIHLKKITQKSQDSYMKLLNYHKSMGGNGASIRAGPIGLFYANDIDKLIHISIMSSRLTHNIPLGYLGGFIVALFASYAYNGIKPWLWIDEFLKLVDNNKIIKYINSTDIGTRDDEAINDYFLNWYRYKERRVNDIIKYRNKQEFINASLKINELMSYGNNKKLSQFGSTGLDACIIAYDSLLLSIMVNDKFEIDINNPVYNPEMLVFNSALHFGDSDSTAVIAGFWFGALLGYNGFDKNKMKQLEFYNDLSKLSKKLISKLT